MTRGKILYIGPERAFGSRPSPNPKPNRTECIWVGLWPGPNSSDFRPNRLGPIGLLGRFFMVFGPERPALVDNKFSNSSIEADGYTKSLFDQNISDRAIK